MPTKPKSGPRNGDDKGEPTVVLDTSELTEIDVDNPGPLIGDYLADADINPTPEIIVTDENELPPGWEDVAESTLDEIIPSSGQVPEMPSSSYSTFVNTKAHEQAKLYENWLPPQSALPPLKKVRYEGRVRVIEAWRFDGVIHNAPEYVDRNWLAYGGYDDERKIQPGPMIQMPMDPQGRTHKDCRIGDYIVRQEIKLNLDRPPEEKIEVWPRDEFERVFIAFPENDGPENLALTPPRKGKAA